MDIGHQRANECHRIRWEQCRIERSRRDIRGKYPDRAHWSLSFRRYSPSAPYFSKYRSLNEVDLFTKQLCVQVVGATSRSAAGKLQAGHPERKSQYLHQESNKHGSQVANIISLIAEYGASFSALPIEAFVDPR